MEAGAIYDLVHSRINNGFTVYDTFPSAGPVSPIVTSFLPTIA